MEQRQITIRWDDIAANLKAAAMTGLQGGRRVATAEGTLKDRAGKLYAHGTTTRFIFALSDLR